MLNANREPSLKGGDNLSGSQTPSSMPVGGILKHSDGHYRVTQSFGLKHRQESGQTGPGY